jgi:hypothetical protein
MTIIDGVRSQKMAVFTALPPPRTFYLAYRNFTSSIFHKSHAAEGNGFCSTSPFQPLDELANIWTTGFPWLTKPASGCARKVTCHFAPSEARQIKEHLWLNSLWESYYLWHCLQRHLSRRLWVIDIWKAILSTDHRGNWKNGAKHSLRRQPSPQFNCL